MFQSRIAHRRVWAFTILSLTTIMAAAGGCGSAARCHPVRGRVLLGKVPIAEAKVVFHPLDGQLPGGQRPQAFTDEHGRFTLMTERPGDGAPEGEYAITVEL